MNHHVIQFAGAIQFDNMVDCKKTKQGYKLVWQDSLIFPDLESDDKISVTTSKRSEEKY